MQKQVWCFNEYFASCTLNVNDSVSQNWRFIIQHLCLQESNCQYYKQIRIWKIPWMWWSSVSMLKLCAEEISTPLQIIFNDCFKFGMFPDSWKYANVQPIHKKDNCQLKTNYRPIFLLPICGKVLEKIVFDQICHPKNQSYFVRVIQQYTSYFTSLQLYMNSLKNTMKRVLFFWIYLKLLVRFGMIELILNKKVIAYQEIFFIL